MFFNERTSAEHFGAISHFNLQTFLALEIDLRSVTANRFPPTVH
jgi:hypothetical protein